MRSDRDIDAILDAWLAPGPTQMPDRVFYDVLDRVERTPQRHVALTPRRLFTMFPLFRFSTAAVVAAIILGLATFPFGQAPSDVGSAPAESAAPSASPESAAAGSYVVAPLSGRWVGPARSIDGLLVHPDISYWWMDRYGLGVATPDEGGTDLSSDATDLGSGRFHLVSQDDTGGCPAGSVGVYTWSLSQADTHLAVEPVEDACPQRAAYLSGGWTREGYCGIEYRDCTGDLPAGRFEAGEFNPRASADRPIEVRNGAFSFDVPEGWANDLDNPWNYQLTTSAGYARQAAGAPGGADEIFLGARPVALLPAWDKDCQAAQDSSVGTTVDDLVSFLTTHPGLRVITDPSDVTIDGNPGVVLDIDIDPAGVPASPCQEAAPFVPFFADAAAFDTSGTWTNGGWDAWIGEAPSDPIRVILLDLDGQPLFIAMDSADPAGLATWVDQATPIVESFSFPK